VGAARGKIGGHRNTSTSLRERSFNGSDYGKRRQERGKSFAKGRSARPDGMGSRGDAWPEMSEKRGAWGQKTVGPLQRETVPTQAECQVIMAVREGG